MQPITYRSYRNGYGLETGRAIPVGAIGTLTLAEVGADVPAGGVGGGGGAVADTLAGVGGAPIVAPDEVVEALAAAIEELDSGAGEFVRAGVYGDYEGGEGLGGGQGWGQGGVRARAGGDVLRAEGEGRRSGQSEVGGGRDHIRCYYCCGGVSRRCRCWGGVGCHGRGWDRRRRGQRDSYYTSLTASRTTYYCRI